jgi:type II secretory pathway predicted ATPase ExeA
MSAGSTHPDPFSLTANPSLYVRRSATERALEELEGWIERGARTVALIGPAGIGKTLLLRVLAERLPPRYAVACLPYPALPSVALCRWALQLLGDTQAEDPERELMKRAQQESAGGRPVVLLLDDVDSMPPSALQRLEELTTRSAGALRLVMAALEEDDVTDPFVALASPPEVVRLDEPMGAEETARYVRARLEATQAPSELWSRFDHVTLASLQERSGGIPARVHEFATALVRGQGISAPDLAAPHPEAATEDEPIAREEKGRMSPTQEVASSGSPEPSRDALSPPPRHPLAGLPSPWAAVLAATLLVALAWGTVRSLQPDTDPGRGANLPAAPTPRAAERPFDRPGVEPRRPESAGSTVSGESSWSTDPLAVGPPQRMTPVGVNLNATPWAEIEVDGLRIGLTPLAGVPLSPGQHVFRAKMPDGRILERSIRIGPEHRHVTFE